MINWSKIEAAIAMYSDTPFEIVHKRSVGGGSINEAFYLADAESEYFVKVNDASRVEMFSAEAEGLLAIAATNSIRTPLPVCWDTAGKHSFLVLEWIKLSGVNTRSVGLLGHQLAKMHQKRNIKYGWYRSNTIGSTPQHNPHELDWATFFIEHRLRPQLALAANNGFLGGLQSKGESLLEVVPNFFDSYVPAASLLHGDLWAGNAGYDEKGNPVIFDPAVYFGDREADIAMTELFGGFGRDFYAAYNEIWPLDEDYSVRKTLYNLYHILNHVNIFGSSYLRQAENYMDILLSETHA